MKEQHRYGIIISVLLLTIAFIFNDYSTNISEKDAKISKVVSNINNTNRIVDDFLSKTVNLGEFTVEETKLTIVESEFDGKSNKVSHDLYNGKNHYSSRNIEDLQISNRDKDESINM